MVAEMDERNICSVDKKVDPPHKTVAETLLLRGRLLPNPSIVRPRMFQKNIFVSDTDKLCILRSIG